MEDDKVVMKQDEKMEDEQEEIGGEIFSEQEDIATCTDGSLIKAALWGGEKVATKTIESANEPTAKQEIVAYKLFYDTAHILRLRAYSRKMNDHVLVLQRGVFTLHELLQNQRFNTINDNWSDWKKQDLNIVPKLWDTNSSIYRPSDYLNGFIKDLLGVVGSLQKMKVRHGNLTPRNILFVKDCNDQFQIKLSNFAYFSSPSNASITLKARKLGWLAPEEFRNASGELKSDVFSLGLIIHYMIACRHPFASVNRLTGELTSVKFPAFFKVSTTIMMPEASDLLTSLLKITPHDRVCPSLLKSHPYFWKSCNKALFIIEFANMLTAHATVPVPSDVFKYLNITKKSVILNNLLEWSTLIPSGVLTQSTSYNPKRDSKLVTSLVMFVRNVMQHLEEFTNLGASSLETAYDKLLLKLPNLLIELYVCAKTYCPANARFEAYYRCEGY